MSMFLDIFSALLSFSGGLDTNRSWRAPARLGSTTGRQHRQSCLMHDYPWSFICSNISVTSDRRSLRGVFR
jgi:hypothetical protein